MAAIRIFLGSAEVAGGLGVAFGVIYSTRRNGIDSANDRRHPKRYSSGILDFGAKKVSAGITI
jgi:hypothetical protein